MPELMMATSMTDDVPRYARAAIESMSPDDFDTASIRSAAPSYTSDAPSYHSINPHPDPLPAYSPPIRPTPSSSSTSTTTLSTTTTTTSRNTSVSSLLGPDPSPPTTRRYGLPPVPSGPLPTQPSLPSLSQFRIPTSSSLHTSNPTARIYQNVALRRASAAAETSSHNASTAALDGLMRRVMLERIEEEERTRVRPLEDPYLVGEEAAARARQERVARERRWDAEEEMVREERRWDWFLAQMRDREDRERSWRRFRRDMDRRSNSGLAFRIGGRF